MRKAKRKIAIWQIWRLFISDTTPVMFSITNFLTTLTRHQYVSEQRVAILSRYFAGLAILISCLGLFGLAAFNAEIRTKEIGIRKVLGASVKNVMLLLSKDFLRLIVFAIVIAFPIAWWAMHQWLNGYAYHISIKPAIFIVAAISILFIALITLSYQSIKTAVMNPVKSLTSGIKDVQKQLQFLKKKVHKILWYIRILCTFVYEAVAAAF